MIPADRTFRNAWVQAGGVVQTDMAKARGLAQGRIRLAREPRFKHWDQEWMRAQEDNDAAAMAQVKAKKQALRDAPADPQLAAAPNEAALKAAMQAVIASLP